MNQTFSQAVKLPVGSATESVEVSANAAELLQRSSSELGTVIQADVVQDMPLNGRNFTELLILTPGATPVSTAQGSGVTTQDAGMSGVPNSVLVKPALHGQQNRSTLYYLDAVTNTDLRGPVYGVLPMLDATQQFKVQSHNEKVEFGGVVGGVVNMVSRAGTNAFHGSAFEFIRNNYFDARDPFKDEFNSGPAPFHQNQFGGTLFGPLIRNRTFFAVSYEGWRFSQPPQTFGYVPTAAELGGDFTNNITYQANNADLIYNPYSTVGTKTRSQFTCDASGNPITPNTNGTQTGGTPCMKIPSQLVNTTMSGIMKAFLLAPNFAGSTVPGQVGTNFEENRPHIDNNNEFQVKVDHQISSRDNVWIRFTNMYVTDLAPVTGTIEYAPSWYHGYDWGVGYTRVLTQHMIYDAQAGLLLKPYTFNQNTVMSTGYQQIQKLGIADASEWGGLYFALAAPYITSPIGTEANSLRKNPTWSASTDLSYIFGKHNAKVGLQFTNVQRVQENTYQDFSYSTQQTENPANSTVSAETGNIVASALLGLPSSYSGQLPTYGEDDFSFQFWSGFLEDEWRVMPKLTINYGVRYDYLTVPKILNGRISGQLDLTKQEYTIGSATVPNCGTPAVNPCIPGTTGISGLTHGSNIQYAGFNKYFLAPKASEFEPRVGLAYQLRDDLVLRGGWGLFYDALPARSQYAQNELDAAYWPWATGFSGNANAVGSANTSINAIEGSFPSPVTSSNPWGIGGYYDDPHFRPAYANEWNIELQQQLDKFTSLSIAYVGSSDVHNDYTGYANAAPFASAPTVARATVDTYRPIPWAISSLHWGASSGHSSYNALETRIMRQATRQLRMILSYTWGKSLDNSSGYFGAENGIGGGSAVQNYWDPRSNRGVSSFDIGEYVSLASLWELPFGHGKKYLQHGALAYIVGDWQMNTLLQARSGQPYNLTVNGDVANIEGSLNSISGYARPDVNPGVNITPAHRGVSEWFNPQAFLIPGGTVACSGGICPPNIGYTAPYGFGTYPRNALFGGPVWYADCSMFKLIPIHDQIDMQLRFEAFNVFNVQSLSPPGAGNSNQVLISGNGTSGSSGAGAISSVAYNPRQLQFGVRLTF